jgi:kynureninase
MTIGLDLQVFRAAYARFLDAPEAASRVLLTGHSHQAWPDVARDALAQCFDDAARSVDDKWGDAVFPRIDSVGRRVLARMGFDPADPIAFGKSTHELVFRLMTCLPLREGTRIVTTDSEFHSLHRQTSRLAEEGVEITWVPGFPREGLAERLLDALVPGVSMVAFSAVMFEDAFVVPRLGDVLARARGDRRHRARRRVPRVQRGRRSTGAPRRCGTAPSSRRAATSTRPSARVSAGSACRARARCARSTRAGSPTSPRSRARARTPSATAPGARFSGATFDPASFYRADAVLDHWDRFGLGPAELRAISVAQTTRVIARLDARGRGAQVASSRDPARRGGFVAVRTPHADEVTRSLRKEGVFVDARGDLLRIGPAPYLTDDELDRGVDRVAAALADPGSFSY